MNFHHGSFIDTEHVVLIEVRLLDTSFVDCDLAFQRRGQPVDDGTAHLLFHDGRVHDVPAIHGAHETVHTHLTLVHRHFRHLRRVAAYVVHHCHAAESSGRQRLTPVRLL